MKTEETNEFGESFRTIRLQGLVVALTGNVQLFVLSYLLQTILMMSEMSDKPAYIDLVLLLLILYSILLFFVGLINMLLGITWILLPWVNHRISSSKNNFL